MNRPSARNKTRQAPLPRNIYRRTPLPGRSRYQPQPDVTCGIKSKCGACKYVNLDYLASLADKRQAGEQILADAGVLAGAKLLAPEASPRPLGYRSVFKLAVRPARHDAVAHRFPSESPEAPAPRFAIGLFAAGSHDVVNMDECPLHTPPLHALLADLRRELEASPLTPYDETNQTGTIRYIAARAAHLTAEVMLTFVVTSPHKAELRTIVTNLQRRGHNINSAHMNLNSESGNAIFGAETIRLAGTDRLRERLCDLDFEVGPTAFFQVNPWQAINLYRRIEAIAGATKGLSSKGAPAPAPVAWDLYCGTGQISLLLARAGYRVLGIEENPHAVNDARANARKNHLSDNATFLAARVEDSQPLLPSWSQSPELIVANPSRRGLAEETRRHLAILLAANPTARFLYVSCDVTTLARDLRALADLCAFQVRQIEPFDMFPQTDNMEWLAVMSRG